MVAAPWGLSSDQSDKAVFTHSISWTSFGIITSCQNRSNVKHKWRDISKRVKVQIISNNHEIEVCITCRHPPEADWMGWKAKCKDWDSHTNVNTRRLRQRIVFGLEWFTMHTREVKVRLENLEAAMYTYPCYADNNGWRHISKRVKVCTNIHCTSCNSSLHHVLSSTKGCLNDVKVK